MQQQTSSPKITFRVSENEIPESPKLSALALQEMSRQLGLEEIEIEMQKHHGVSVHDIIFVLLLYFKLRRYINCRISKQGQESL